MAKSLTEFMTEATDHKKSYHMSMFQQHSQLGVEAHQTHVEHSSTADRTSEGGANSSSLADTHPPELHKELAGHYKAVAKTHLKLAAHHAKCAGMSK
jgi:hypothetical protein